MKKTKVLFALAIVIAMFSFGFKAKAQTTVPVTLVSRSGTYTGSNWTTSTTVWVTLHNNTTNEDFYFQTNSGNYDSDTDTFHLGNITEGTYTVTFSYYNSTIWADNFEWQAEDVYDASPLYMYGGNDYTVTDSATASSAIGEFYLMLYHI